MPLISIITSTLNSAKHLGTLANSLRAQTCKDFEWIIVDGKSSDGTVDIVEENMDLVSSFTSEIDDGIYDAWNKGIKEARGDWICFVGSDDYFLHVDSIKEIGSSLSGIYPHHRISYRPILIVNHRGEELYTIGLPWLKAKRQFRSVMTLPHPGLMHHRTLFEEFGLFDTSFKIAGDYDFLLRVLKKQGPHYGGGRPLLAMRLGGVSSDPQGSLRTLYETRRASKMHGQSVPRPSIIWAFLRYYLRTFLLRLLSKNFIYRILDYGRIITGKPKHWTKL